MLASEKQFASIVLRDGSLFFYKKKLIKMKKFRSLDGFKELKIEDTLNIVGGATCYESSCTTDDCDTSYSSAADNDKGQLDYETYHEWTDFCG